jgi:hypothetical protein
LAEHLLAGVAGDPLGFFVPKDNPTPFVGRENDVAGLDGNIGRVREFGPGFLVSHSRHRLKQKPGTHRQLRMPAG